MPIDADRAVPAGRRGVPVERLERRRAGAGRRAGRSHRRAGQDLGQPAGCRPGRPGGGRLRGGAGQPAAGCASAGPTRCEPGASTWPGTRSRCRRRRARTPPPRRRPSAGWSRSPLPWWSGVRPARCPAWATPPYVLVLRSDIDVRRQGGGRGRPAAVPGPGRAGPVRAARAAGGRRRPGQLRRAGRAGCPGPDRPDRDRTRCPASCWPERSVKGRIEPGATRQEVGYLSDPAIGGVRFGLPGGRGRRRPGGQLAAAGHGPAGRRGRRGHARGRSRTPTPTYGCSCPRRRSSAVDAELPRSPTRCSTTSRCGSG